MPLHSVRSLAGFYIAQCFVKCISHLDSSGICFNRIYDFSVRFLKVIEGTPHSGRTLAPEALRLNHPVEHIQKPKLAKLFVRVETSTTYFIIIYNQFVK